MTRICCCSVAKSYLTLCDPWTAARQASLFFTISQSLLKLISIESVMPSNHLILCHPLLLLPSIFYSIRVFSNELTVPIRWPKYWSFNFSISPSNECSGLISFRIDWLDLVAVQEFLRLFSNTTAQKHQFFSAQLSLWFGSHIHTWQLERINSFKFSDWRNELGGKGWMAVFSPWMKPVIGRGREKKKGWQGGISKDSAKEQQQYCVQCLKSQGLQGNWSWKESCQLGLSELCCV